MRCADGRGGQTPHRQHAGSRSWCAQACAVFWQSTAMLALAACPTLALADDATATTTLGLDQIAALRISQAVVGKTVDDFTLLNRDGQPIRLSQYRGKPLLVSFIYTGCFQVCPVTTQSLQNALAGSRSVFGADQFNVVSIGFNQPSDSPQALKAFALQHRIDQPNWEFLSPHASLVEPLARAFGFNFVATPAGFDHVLQVSLVDAQGRIYRQVYGEDLNADSLGAPLRQLLMNAPVTEQLGWEDLVNRVRILCTVYDPKSGTYRFQYGLLIEVAGGITFALAVLWFFLAEWRTQRRVRKSRLQTALSQTDPST